MYYTNQLLQGLYGTVIPSYREILYIVSHFVNSHVLWFVQYNVKIVSLSSSATNVVKTT